MINIALFGPPCSGKGTQASLLVEKYQLLHISTGDILRKEIELETDWGKEVKPVIEKGCLVKDDLIFQIMMQYINENRGSQGVLFDGFPRTEKQCQTLDGLLSEMNTSLDRLIFLDVPEDELKRRMLQRSLVAGRSDDTEEIINKRLEEYYEKSLPVMHFYETKKKVIHIDGDDSIERIFQRIEAVILDIKQQKL